MFILVESFVRLLKKNLTMTVLDLTSVVNISEVAGQKEAITFEFTSVLSHAKKNTKYILDGHLLGR